MRPFLQEQHWVGYDLPTERSITPASPPLTIDRNYKAHSLHQFLSKASKPSSILKQPPHSQQAYLAQQEAIYYADQVSDSHIPLGLLEYTLHDDFHRDFNTSHSAAHVCRSSILQVKHDHDFHGVVGVSGEHLDELMMRNASFLQPQLDWSSSPGFNLMLTHGAPIRQLIHAGFGCYGLNSHILACTIGEVYHLQTIDPEGSRSLSFCPMLEPKGKWQLPNEILTMASFGPHHSSVTAVIMTRYGDLYSWSPHRGVLREQQINQFNPNCRLDRNSAVLEFSAHPRVLYLADESSTLSQVDLRSKGRHTKNTFSEQQTITVICQHRQFEHQYMVSAGENLWLMDNRYERQCLYSRHVGVSYHHIEFQAILNDSNGNGHGEEIDLFLCRSREHDSLHLHTLDSQSSKSSSSFQLSHWNSSQTLSDMNHMPQRWNTTAFPIVDSDLWCIGSTCILPTVDDIAILQQSLPEQWTEEMRQEAERYGRRRYDGIIVQQSAVGDIFAQRLKITRKPEDDQYDQNGVKKAGNTEMDVESIISSIESEHDGEVERVKVDDNDNLSLTESNSSESHPSNDDDDDQSTFAELPNGTLTKAYENYPQLPSIQMNLAGGSIGACPHNSLSFRQEMYLAFARPGGHKIDNRSWLRSYNPLLYQDSLAVCCYLRESSKLHPGMQLTNSLPFHDFASNTFPTSSKQYRLYLPEDSMQGCSVFLFFPQDMRRDWKEQLQLPPVYTLLQRGFEEINSDHDGESELQELLMHYCEYLAENGTDFPLTLWEVWHGLLHKYQRKVPLDLLRRSLQELIGAEGENLLPSRITSPVHGLFSAYSDGLFVEHRRRQKSRNSHRQPTSSSARDAGEAMDEEGNISSENYGCQCDKYQLWKRNGNLSRGCGRRDCILPHFLTYQLNEPHNVAGQTPVKNSQQSQLLMAAVKRTDVTPLTREAVLDRWDEMIDALFA